MDRGSSGAGTPAASLPAAADAGTANSAAVNQSSVPHGRATRFGIRIDRYVGAGGVGMTQGSEGMGGAVNARSIRRRYAAGSPNARAAL